MTRNSFFEWTLLVIILMAMYYAANYYVVISNEDIKPIVISNILIENKKDEIIKGEEERYQLDIKSTLHQFDVKSTIHHQNLKRANSRNVNPKRFSNNERENEIWAKLVSENCPVDFSDVIKYHLKPWSDSGITIDMLDQIYCTRKQVVRVSIVNGSLRQENWQLNMDHQRMFSSFWLLRLMIRRAKERGNPLPDVEFIANPNDKTSKFASGRNPLDPLSHAMPKMPLFCNAKCDGDESISFPFMFNSPFGQSQDGKMSLIQYQNIYEQLKKDGSPFEWEKKIPKMFFSGLNERGHRADLLRKRDSNMVTLAMQVEMAKYGKYQYLVYTYGHSGWSRRLREMAFMNTVVLMENSSCHEFYWHPFKPGVHYIPVQEDLSDLSTRLAAAIADPGCLTCYILYYVYLCA